MSDPVTYNDEDLVYVDPDAKAVVGRVEFNEKGHAKPLAMPPKFAEPENPVAAAAAEPDQSTPEPAGSGLRPAGAKPDTAAKPGPKGKIDRRPPRKPRIRYYPWGTYRTMKKIYKIEGKIPEPERTLTLNDVMEKALQEPYWD